MGINLEGAQKSNEEIEKEQEERERQLKVVDKRRVILTEGNNSEKSVEERVRDAQAAIEASNKKDREEFLKKKMAEFDKNVLATASKVTENPDALTEDKEKATEAAQEATSEAEEIAQKTRNAFAQEAVHVSEETQKANSSKESVADGLDSPARETAPIKTGEAAEESAAVSGVKKESTDSSVSESAGGKKPWDQMSQKEREDAACQAALGALNNIAADQKPSLWERMKAGWSSLNESAKEKWEGAKAGLLKKVFGENNEKLKNTWGFLKERLKGVATFGIWEFHQAEKFRAATRDIGKDVNAQSRIIEEESGLSKEEALKEAEEMRSAFEKINREPTAQEYELMSQSISAEKIKFNERVIENIIQDATKSLEDRLEKRSLLQGYRSADVGKKVLTPEKIALLQERMRHQLNGMRNGQVRGDFKQYAQLMRRNLDPGWWKRYIYGGVEVALDGLALHLVTAPGAAAAEAAPAHAIGGAPNVVPPPAELVDPMHQTIWRTTAEFLKAHGIANPTNAQIMEGSKLVAQGNHIGVNVWNIPGNPLDTHMQAGYLLKLKPLVENLARIQAM